MPRIRTEKIDPELREEIESAITRLETIGGEIKELVHEAEDLVETYAFEDDYERARSYWIPHIIMSIDKEHEWIGGAPMYILEDTIEAMKEDLEDVPEEEPEEEPETNPRRRIRRRRY